MTAAAARWPALTITLFVVVVLGVLAWWFIQDRRKK